MRSDSERDGIKREHVIFTQAYLRSRPLRANYFYVSASASQIWSWGGDPGYAPDFPQRFCHFCFCS